MFNIVPLNSLNRRSTPMYNRQDLRLYIGDLRWPARVTTFSIISFHPTFDPAPSQTSVKPLPSPRPSPGRHDQLVLHHCRCRRRPILPGRRGFRQPDVLSGVNWSQDQVAVRCLRVRVHPGPGFERSSAPGNGVGEMQRRYG